MSIAHTSLRELVAALARAQRALAAGDGPGARAAVAEALAIDPENVQARDVLAALEQPPAIRLPERRPDGPGKAAADGALHHGVVNTASWLAFEGRVRARRAMRLADEAETALREGRREQAAEAVEELRRLSPEHDRLATLEQVLEAARIGEPVTVRIARSEPPDTASAPPPWLEQATLRSSAPSASEPAAHSATGATLHTRRAGSVVPLAVVVVLAAVLGGLMAHRQFATSEGTVNRSLAEARLPAVIPAPRSARAAPNATPTTNLLPPSTAAGGPVADTESQGHNAEKTPNVTPSRGTTSPDAATVVSRSAPAPAPGAPQRAAAASPRVPEVTPDLPADAPPPAPAATPTSSGPPDSTPPPVDRVPSAPAEPALVARAAPLLAEPLEPSLPPRPVLEDVEDTPRATTGRGTPPSPAGTGGSATAALDPALRPPSSARTDAGARLVLDQYRQAYNSLDAAAAQRAWPTVDGRALERAFRQLESQSVAFERCDVTATGATGQAVCRGRASWAPAIGDRTPRQETRTWRFTLSQRGSRWVITNVRVDRR